MCLHSQILFCVAGAHNIVIDILSASLGCVCTHKYYSVWLVHTTLSSTFSLHMQEVSACTAHTIINNVLFSCPRDVSTHKYLFWVNCAQGVSPLTQLKPTLCPTLYATLQATLHYLVLLITLSHSYTPIPLQSFPNPFSILPQSFLNPSPILPQSCLQTPPPSHSLHGSWLKNPTSILQII